MSLSHIDANNNPGMVDVGTKEITKRTAIARTIVVFPEIIKEYLKVGEIHTKKGPVFQTAIIAGTMACKKTADLIPLCHPLALDNCKIAIQSLSNGEIEILCTVSCTGKTGVEMEALTGASVAALTIYDMCKALSHEIEISSTKLVSKTGGKSDFKMA
jgi:cyclic pyranopterin monophosphate synthase